MLRSRQAGLTLIELMIAVTLGLLLLIAVGSIFMRSNRESRENEAAAGLQDAARFALDNLATDLAKAGFSGGLPNGGAVFSLYYVAAARNALPAADQCGGAGATNGFLFDLTRPLAIANNGSAGTTFGCLNGVIATNSDAVLIRRAAGQAAVRQDAATTTAPTLTVNRYYIKTNGSFATLLRWPAGGFAPTQPDVCVDANNNTTSCAPLVAPVQYYAYTPKLYYVRAGTGTVGTAAEILSRQLCRRTLVDTGITPTFTEECLVDGIETLQIEWGITSNSRINAPAYYTSTPSEAEFDLARTARIHLIVRSGTANAAKTGAGTKTIAAADYPAETSTNVQRKHYSTVVDLRNFWQ